MKDIEILMEKAKNGDQSAFDYLYDNSLGVFALDFNDDEELSVFLEECSDAKINLSRLADILEYLAQKGYEWAFAYLYENGFGVFCTAFNGNKEFSDFLDKCEEAGIEIQEYLDDDRLRELAMDGHQWAFDYFVAEGRDLYIENNDDVYFLIECENNGVDIGEYDDFIYEGVEYGNGDFVNHVAELGAFSYLDVDGLATYDWVEEHLEGNNEVAEIASNHLMEVFRYKEDINWLKKQADEKIPQAQFLLGLLYLGDGGVIDKNESLALRYLKAANAGGCKLAEEYLTKIEHVQERLISEKEQAKKQAKELAQKAIEFIERAEKGDLSISELVTLATDLAHGDSSKGIKKNANKATKFYRMAAEQGNAEAQCQMGIRMIEGVGCRKNWNAGIKWLKKSLKGGYEPAKIYLSEYDTFFNRILHKFIK